MSLPMVVGRGVDTLVLNIYYKGRNDKPYKQPIPDELKEQLDAWKQSAIVAEEPIPIPVIFEGSNLHMYPNGAGKGQWRWLMCCDAINVLVSMGRLNGIAQVRLSSEYLWSCYNVDHAWLRVEMFMAAFLKSRLYVQISEAHVCVDIAGWDVEAIDQRRDFVSRSHKRSLYEVTDFKVEDFSCGLHRSGFLFSKGSAISCAIYDKTREIREQSQKWWFHDLWQTSGWDEVVHPQVWRVEFRFKREVLHELSVEDEFQGVEDAFQFSDRLQVLWAYACGHVGGGTDGLPDGWLRCVVPGVDTNRSRWVTHPVWLEVQKAFAVLPDEEENRSEIIRKRKRQAHLDRATAATVGYLSSMAAWLGCDGTRGEEADFLYMLHWLRERTPVYLGKRHREFAKEVEKKRVRFEQQRQEEKEALGITDVVPTSR